MPKDKDFKRVVRDRMRETGERYAEARSALRPDEASVPPGERLRGVLELPDGSTVGTLYIAHPGKRRTRRVGASGRVEIAEGERVLLRVHKDLRLPMPSREEFEARPELFDEIAQSLPELHAKAPEPDFAALDAVDETLIDLLEFDTVGSPADVSRLPRFRSLTSLSLRLIDPFSDDDFAFLRAMTWLERLLILNPATTDGLLRHLPLDSLRHLELPRCGITDHGAHEIARYTSLEGINLAETKISDDGARALLALPDLAELQLADTAITDDTVHAIARRTAPIRRVGVKGCDDVTEAAIEALQAANPDVVLLPPFTWRAKASGRDAP